MASTESCTGASVDKEFLDDVLTGLQSPRKNIPAKYFYDQRGSQLFDRICELPEYYLTRAELEIMQSQIDDIVETLGDDCVLVEYGSGSSLKTEILLENLQDVTYVPIDISGDYLDEQAGRLSRQFPHLDLHPLCTDFTQPFDLPAEIDGERTVVYFPGSTIGNFDPQAGLELLESMAKLAGDDGGVLIGVDLKKQRDILEPAYNDREGVTGEFNRNLLRRMNRELGANFRLDRFEHRAVYNEPENRMEMHLVSQADQCVRISGVEIPFRKGESIHTENCYKYSLSQFHSIAHRAGLVAERVWLDARQLFSVQFLSVAAESSTGRS